VLPLALAALATAQMVVVAAMTQAGFTGSTRYLTIPVALTCVLGGAGCVVLARRARDRLAAGRAAVVLVLAVVVAAPFVVHVATRTRSEIRGGLREMRLYAAVPDAIERAGGAASLRDCPGRVYSEPFDTQVVARALGMHERDVGIHPLVPGTLVGRRGHGLAADRRFPVRAVTRLWVVRSSCRR
jgi:hypothetical protein